MSVSTPVSSLKPFNSRESDVPELFRKWSIRPIVIAEPLTLVLWFRGKYGSFTEPPDDKIEPRRPLEPPPPSKYGKRRVCVVVPAGTTLESHGRPDNRTDKWWEFDAEVDGLSVRLRIDFRQTGGNFHCVTWLPSRYAKVAASDDGTPLRRQLERLASSALRLD